MRSVPQTTHAAPVKRYAVYHLFDDTAIYGTAELLVGHGWLFREDQGQWFELVTPHDITTGRVELCGLVALADAQMAEDLAKREAEAQAQRCEACGLIGCRGGVTCDDGQLVLVQEVA